MSTACKLQMTLSEERDTASGIFRNSGWERFLYSGRTQLKDFWQFVAQIKRSPHWWHHFQGAQCQRTRRTIMRKPGSRLIENWLSLTVLLLRGTWSFLCGEIFHGWMRRLDEIERKKKSIQKMIVVETYLRKILISLTSAEDGAKIEVNLTLSVVSM